ncbi:hypothetical protein M1432_02520 [Patescibacteria group bacterium]|nr:hypothetical protein [Patescibacteria group bacterium]
MVFVYLSEQFVFRIAEFLRHWYLGSARVYFDFLIDRFRDLDRVLAFKITLQHFFEPLYGDYSIVGRLIGLPLRLFRLLVGTAVYLVLGIAALAVYAIWWILPVYVIARIFV